MRVARTFLVFPLMLVLCREACTGGTSSWHKPYRGLESSTLPAWRLLLEGEKRNVAPTRRTYRSQRPIFNWHEQFDDAHSKAKRFAPWHLFDGEATKRIAPWNVFDDTQLGGDSVVHLKKRFVFSSFGWGPGGTPRTSPVGNEENGNAAGQPRGAPLDAAAIASFLQLSEQHNDVVDKLSTLNAVLAQNDSAFPITGGVGAAPATIFPPKINLLAKLGLNPASAQQWLNSRPTMLPGAATSLRRLAANGDVEAIPLGNMKGRAGGSPRPLFPRGVSPMSFVLRARLHNSLRETGEKLSSTPTAAANFSNMVEKLVSSAVKIANNPNKVNTVDDNSGNEATGAGNDPDALRRNDRIRRFWKAVTSSTNEKTT